jgi:hypothetical protein
MILLTATADDGTGVALSVLAFGLSFYFLPFIIALIRGHHQRLAIFIMNLFLGWTFIGWIASLIWACTKTGVPNIAPVVINNINNNNVTPGGEYVEPRIVLSSRRPPVVVIDEEQMYKQITKGVAPEILVRRD